MRSTVKLSSTIFRRNTSFGVERERRESERKKIEAEGIREFQRVVSQGISDSYLRWRGIEATLQLSQSTNSKVVIIGSAKDGLPLILGNMDAAPAQGTAGAAPESGQTEPKETTAAGGTKKTPAAGLTESLDKDPTTGSAVPPAAGAEGSRSLWPLSLYDIDAFLSRTIRPTESATKPLQKQPAEQPAAPELR